MLIQLPTKVNAWIQTDSEGQLMADFIGNGFEVLIQNKEIVIMDGDSLVEILPINKAAFFRFVNATNDFVSVFFDG